MASNSPAPYHVFVDTNVWLTFYAFANDDLEQLKKVIALVQNGKLKLYIPQQVVDEFYRNREGKLDESIREFAKSQVSKSIPRYMLEYPEVKKYRDALAEFQAAKDSLVTRAKAEAEKKELAADKLFSDILSVSAPIPADDKLLAKAVQRRIRGNPPGKPTSTGDQFIWEVLLHSVPDGSDLHVVSNDGDYESKLQPGRADQFLIDEWSAKKGALLVLHNEIRPFLNSKFPGIHLAVDLEKQESIARLISSGSFSSTHYAVAKLMPLVDQLTWTEADQIVDAALDNSQIRWIGTDDDVQALYSRIIERFEGQFDPFRLNALKSVITPSIEEPASMEIDEDVPF